MAHNEQLIQEYDFTSGDLLESTNAWWEARGKAANNAADRLETLAKRVDLLCRTNYWGDCVEGYATHDLFREIVTTWAADLRQQSISARNLSNACFDAARIISTTDQESADGIAPA